MRNRGGNKCAVCGSKLHTQAHHILSRQILPTRWLPGNGIPLCPLHHFYGALSAHKNPVWFMQWMAEHRPGQLRYIMELEKQVEEYQAKLEAVDRDYRKKAKNSVWKSKRRKERA